jgi:gamma-glutamyltranspeptidase/glutathione hydrolase
VAVEHHGWTVCKTGPWGQGPVLLQQLRLLEGFDLEAMGLGSAAYVHTVAECAKLAFADREAWYGDPAAIDVPLDGLLDQDYADRRRALVTDEASLELRPGSPSGRSPRLPSAGTGPAEEEWAGPGGSGEPTFGDTCHLDVVDRHGNLVAATPSGGWLQSSPIIPGLGFCLGTRAQMLWLEEGLASSLRPGTRPRTTLSPSLGLRDGQPCLAFGTPGGDAQDQWSLQFFLAHARFGRDLQEAADTPSFQSDHFPSSFWPRRADPGRLVVEARHDPEVVEELRARGHQVELAEPWSLGRTCAAGRDPATGFLVAAANPRGRQAYAVGR